MAGRKGMLSAHAVAEATTGPSGASSAVARRHGGQGRLQVPRQVSQCAILKKVKGATITLPNYFARSLKDHAEAPALEWRGQLSTFGQVARRADRIARVLRGRGIVKGDRLALYLPNSPLWIELYLACVSIGAIAVPVNILYRDREIGHIVADVEPSAVVARNSPVPGVDQRLVWPVDELVGHQAADLPTDVDDPAAASVALSAEPPDDPSDPALIVYTSGTTGRPKGAVLSHANLVANAAALLTAWRITSRDRLLLTLPLFHVHGLGNGLHCWLGSGCLLRLEERFDHQLAAQWFREFRPTVFFGVPTIYSRLVEIDERTARDLGSSARLFVSGSAPLPSALLERFEERFGHRILERYGMTETLMTLGNPLDGERRAGSVGVPLPGVEARVADANDTPLPDGAVGELQVRGPAVFNEYWRQGVDTAAAFTTEGWFKTGDIAERAADGYFTLRGRRSDLIISGGFNIYPREVEEVLTEHPTVSEAAVVGVPDQRRGELPVAFIVPAAGQSIDIDTLERHCRLHLASFKVPRRFETVDRLPRNAMGKVVKGALVP